ncbi:hypothetical protein SAY86_016260 [Trapa natans]|uniref:Uncharacterized protein n=1 Tax=Trapa natans TaxID=22666 RepID=A0AAN7L6J5_TRANT|nr:hypothetical protein SAY86_016260 [Trapa natans]
MASSRLLLRPQFHCQQPSGHRPAAESGMGVASSLGKSVAFDGDLRKSTPKLLAKRRPTDVTVKAAPPAVAPDGVITTTDLWWSRVVDSALGLVADAAEGALVILRTAARWRLTKVDIQNLVERAIIDCRFFTCLAVAGTLLGSVLCFLEGSFTVLESYVQYFRSMSGIADQGQVTQLLIEALDTFLVGTAMLIFGVSLHAMFIGSREANNKPWLPISSLFGLYSLAGNVPSWVELRSVSRAKSKIGHAVMIILQVGMLDKFKSVPIATGFDLACFAGAVLLSSACIFILSRLSTDD